MFKKYRRSVVATTMASASVLGLGASAVLAPSAVAASESQAGVFYNCRLYVTEPTVSLDDHTISGFGDSLCAGTGWQDQKITVLLLARPLPTLYEVVAKASTSYSSNAYASQTVSWACTFTGTRTYTLEMAWYGRDGAAYAYKFAAESVKLTCDA